MRRLVKLAYAKQEQANSVETSRATSKARLKKGKTMTNVRVNQDHSTEEKVAHRLSISMQKSVQDALHIRSFSLPKEKTPQLLEEPTSPTSELTEDLATPSANPDDEEVPEMVIPSMDTPQSPSALHQSQDVSSSAAQLAPNDIIGNLKVDPAAKHKLSSNAMISMATAGGSKDMAPDSVLSNSTMTRTMNSDFSETTYIERTNTDYTKDYESNDGYSNLANASGNAYKQRGGGSLMSVGSASSVTMSTFDSSHPNRKGPNHVLPPALETVNEPSSQNINNTKYLDEEMEDGFASRPSVRESVVQNVAAPKIQIDDMEPESVQREDEGEEEEVEMERQMRSRQSVDLLPEMQNAYESAGSGSAWRCLLCGCCESSPAGQVHLDGVGSNESNLLSEERAEAIENDGNESEGLHLDMNDDDWRTFKTGTSRMRRPTQYTTVTNNEDSTISVDDVRMWPEPFGKGASGRVFMGLYMPFCQILALKVTSRLDNDSVKQILGEFKQQQEVLPDCDELMRIHGWYRNLNTNEIAVALEYMDMGSVYDSCLAKPGAQDTVSEEEFNKTGHIQIVVDKLSYDQIRYIARQSLLGLYALHNNSPPLIHRDIKPQNILLSSFGSVKIADFGLLVELKNGVCTDSKGTSKYFSPERIQGSFDCLADIWSLGITLIEIYKQELISAEDLDWFKIVEDGIEIDDFLPATTPTELADFLKQCLQHRSEDRPSAKQLLSHQFITRKWGNPLDEDNLRNISIQFSKEEGNQRLLDTILEWLEQWILQDEEKNANLFLEGDPEYLKQCVYNMSKYTGLPPKYIDRYVADLYREFTQF